MLLYEHCIQIDLIIWAYWRIFIHISFRKNILIFFSQCENLMLPYLSVCPTTVYVSTNQTLWTLGYRNFYFAKLKDHHIKGYNWQMERNKNQNLKDFHSIPTVLFVCNLLFYIQFFVNNGEVLRKCVFACRYCIHTTNSSRVICFHGHLWDQQRNCQVCLNNDWDSNNWMGTVFKQ